MTPEDFIHRSCAYQIGSLQTPLAQSHDAMLRALKGSSGSAIAHDTPPLQIDPDSKAGRALAQILSHDPEFGFVVDMQDRRLRTLSETRTPAYPVFSFNRLRTDRHRILWPLPIYHDLDGTQFLADVRPDAVPWAQKQPRVVWRGITGGRIADSSGTEGIRLKGALRRFREGRIDELALAGLLNRLPRFHALAATQDDPRFDFGFVDGDGYTIADTPLHAPLARPRITRQDMQHCRYIAVLRGLDVGSSFFWVMNSGSVGFVMETPFETFASRHFRPWEHYIPFRQDCTDLVARYDWAEAHQDECRAMTRRAADVCAYLARADLRNAILHRVIAELNRLYSSTS